jgi:vacuolar-type H+-ATPase subunit H
MTHDPDEAGFESLLESLEQLVRSAKSVPLSSSIICARDELTELIEKLKRSMPEDVVKAREIIRERDGIIARAKLEADEIVAAARLQAESMVSKNEIVRSARAEASRITLEAKEKASKLRAQTEDFMDQRLAAFEIALEEILAKTRTGRERLSATRGEIRDFIEGKDEAE